MQNSILIGVGYVAFAVLGVGFGVGTADIAENLTKPVAPFSMQLKELSFKDGQFHQSFDIVGGRSATIANWSAEIKRGSHQLCSAGGTAPYNDSSQGLSSYTPKEWAGPNCPDELKPGDVAQAIWEYRNIDGLIVSTSGTITIKESAIK